MLRSGVRIPYAPPKNSHPSGWLFFAVATWGIRTGAVVNGAPVEPQSRTLTERVERESESPMLHQKNSHPSGWFFCCRSMGDSNGCGSEWGSSGAPEPHPDRARRARERIPYAPPKNSHPSGWLFFAVAAWRFERLRWWIRPQWGPRAEARPSPQARIRIPYAPRLSILTKNSSVSSTLCLYPVM